MKLILYIIFLCSFSTHASVTVDKDTKNDIILNVSEVYVLGDNDTLTDAKAINIEQAKKSASDYAGTYVESELKLLDGKITKQQVRVLSAGFMEVVTRSDKREVNQSGSIQLTTEAKIKLSKQSIKDGIEKLKSDPERQEKVKSLSEDNKRLRNKLIELTRNINTGVSRQDLMADREAILKELNHNRSSAKQVFEEGTLFQLAQLDDRDYSLAKDDINKNLFGYFQNEAKVLIGKPKFTKNTDGTYDITVYVNWKLDGNQVKEVLNKYFDLSIQYDVVYSVSINQSLNRSPKKKHQYSGKLLDYMKNKSVLLVVSAGNKKSTLPLSGLNGFFGREYYVFQYESDDKNYRTATKSGVNPIIIRGVSPSSLKKMTKIEAKIVISNG
ncbi:hypothetical protein [Vibrio marisflavi]|uniref:Peptidase S8/S53 domain-containing protein n=1 Tax=Vibrio marisflavi CECT 7928 TaxID=634439 RepID=A0ABN8E9A4_9VIBR|nr:hypothetical protein [Vibrio marisflavi]CAH0543269.1 hypothetical protein VMF7928_04499 [Vibrio marisflavi CECT 7928]